MSENTDLVRRAYDAFLGGDFAAALAAYAQDTLWDDSRFRPEGAAHRGHDGLAKAVGAWRATWGDYNLEIEELHDAGDGRVVAVVREWGRSKQAGIEVDTRYSQLITLREGRIAETIIYRNLDEAFERAGVER